MPGSAVSVLPTMSRPEIVGGVSDESAGVRGRGGHRRGGGIRGGGRGRRHRHGRGRRGRGGRDRYLGVDRGDRGRARSRRVADQPGGEEPRRRRRRAGEQALRDGADAVDVDGERCVRLRGDVDGDARDAVVGDGGSDREVERSAAEPARGALEVEAPVGSGDQLEDDAARGVEQLQDAQRPRRRLAAPEGDHVVCEHLPVGRAVAEVEERVRVPRARSCGNARAHHAARGDPDDAGRARVIGDGAADGEAGRERRGRRGALHGAARSRAPAAGRRRGGRSGGRHEDRLGADGRNRGSDGHGAAGRVHEADPQRGSSRGERDEREQPESCGRHCGVVLRSPPGAARGQPGLPAG